MGRNTSISLGNHFESFIETTVSSGRFNNAISEGIESGRAIDFDPKKHLETLKSGKKNNK